MARVHSIDEKVEAVQDLLKAKFGVRKRALPKMLAKTGRRLPRGMHKRAQVLIEAQKLGGNPKLMRQMDQTGLTRAYEALTAHLEAIDVAERRKDRLLKLAGVLAFNFLLIVAAFVTWLWWAGYV